MFLLGGEAASAATCPFPLSQSYGSACTDLSVPLSGAGSISNSGAISNTSYYDTIVNQGTISSLTNAVGGTITGVNVYAIHNYATITNLLNAGAISSNDGFTIYNYQGFIETLNNSGTISNSNSQGDAILNFGAIGSLINSNTISGGHVGVRTDSPDTITTFTNDANGTITGGDTGVELNFGMITNFTNAHNITGGSDGIFISGGTIASLNNSGTITGTGNAGINNWDTFTLNNTGTVSGGSMGINSVASGPVSITNNSGGLISGGSSGIYSFAGDRTHITNNLGGVITGADHGVNNELNIESIANAGVISGTGVGGIGVFNSTYSGLSPTISTLTNTGSITGTAYGVYNDDDGYGDTGTISTLTNSGSITGGARGIYNLGVITKLTNSQGGNSSSAAQTALTYEGALPANYFLLVTSATHYGQVSFSNVSGSMTFGVDAGSTLAAGTYSSVFSGLDGSLFSITSGSVSFYKWTLSPVGDPTTPTTWNLVVTPNSIDATTTKPISGLGSTVYSSFRGGTLQVDAAGTYSASVTIDASGTNTIDAAGRAATLSGVLSDETSLGALIFSDSVGGGKITLTGVNTYTGATTILSGAALALSGSGGVAASSGVANAGTFDISATASGASIKALTGAGAVVLGANTLTLTAASGTFAGVVGGTGGLAITGGTQGLSGVNTFTGATTISAGATLALSGSGGVAASSGVANAGTLDISATASGASIKALTGAGAVALGAKTLTLTNASGTISGGIGGSGSLLINAGTQVLAGASTFSGGVTVASGATLQIPSAGALGSGRLALVGSSTTPAYLSVTGTTTIANAITVSGDPVFNIAPGTTTTITSTISDWVGSGDVVVQGGGTLALAAANTYTGATTVASGSTLALQGAGSIAGSSGLSNNGVLDLRGIAGNAAMGGTFTQSASGSLLMAMSATGPRSLSVAGVASLGGTLTLTASPGAYRSGTYHLLSAGSLAGTFSNVSTNLPSFVRLYSLNYTGGSLDLTIVSGPDSVNTNRALVANGGALRNTMSQRASVLAGMLDYDCAVFDQFGLCLSFQALYSGMEAMNEGAGVLTGAYRLSPQLRLGGFVDQGLLGKAPAGLSFGARQPAFGAFLAYSQQAEGLGLQARASGAVSRGGVTITRDSSLAQTEPGSGKARLNTAGAGAELGWGVAWADALTATPYVGFRYVDVTRSAYAESAVSGVVDYPVAYDAFHQRTATATSGLRLKGMATESLGYQLGLGAEYQLHRNQSVYAGTAEISGLEPFALAIPGAANRLSLVGSAGLHYQLARNQRLTGSATLRGQASGSQPVASVLAGYQAAF